MQLLLLLAARPGEVMTREELLEAGWEDVTVGDEALTRAVSELRRALKDDARHPAFIETVPKVGYRLIVQAVPVDDVSREFVTHRQAFPRRQRGLSPGRIGVSGLLVAAVIAVAYVAVSAQSHRRSGFVVERALTTTPGMEIDPALSPDGSRIAFASHLLDQDRWEILVKGVEGERTIRPVEESAGSDRFPVWSSDGGRLAFVRTEEGHCEIRIVPATGGLSRGIHACAPGVMITGLDWASDGITLVYSSERVDGSGGRIGRLAADNGLPATLLSVPAATFRSPHVLPDGGGVVYIGSPGPGVSDIFLLSEGEAIPRRITNLNRSVNGLAVEPDGRHVIATTYHGTHYEVWRTPVRGGESRLIDFGLGSISHPAIASNGGRRAWVRWDFDTDIRQIVFPDSIDTADRWPGTALRSTQRDYLPALSPDGMSLAFISERSGAPQIWMLRSGSGYALPLTDNGSEDVENQPGPARAFPGYFAGPPAWSPDAARIVFAKVDGRSSQTDLFVVEVGDRTVRRLTNDASLDSSPFFGADGQTVYAISDRDGVRGLWRYSLSPGATDPVRVGTIEARFGRLDPRGDGLYVTTSDSLGVWKLSADGDIETFIPLQMDPIEDGANWTISEQGITFVHRETDGSASIVLYDLSSGQRTVRAVEGVVKKNSGLASTPDGSVVFYTVEGRRESDIVVSDF